MVAPPFASPLDLPTPIMPCVIVWILLPLFLWVGWTPPWFPRLGFLLGWTAGAGGAGSKGGLREWGWRERAFSWRAWTARNLSMRSCHLISSGLALFRRRSPRVDVSGVLISDQLLKDIPSRKWAKHSNRTYTMESIAKRCECRGLRKKHKDSIEAFNQPWILIRFKQLQS